MVLERRPLPPLLLQACERHLIGKFPDLLAIYLFGSYSTPYETKESDIDLALITTKPLDSVILWNTAQQIAIEMNRDVDLIDLKEASTVFRYQVLTTGMRMYCTDPKECDAIENSYLSMYLRFQEERHDIIENIVEKLRENK